MSKYISWHLVICPEIDILALAFALAWINPSGG